MTGLQKSEAKHPRPALTDTIYFPCTKNTCKSNTQKYNEFCSVDAFACDFSCTAMRSDIFLSPESICIPIGRLSPKNSNVI